MKKLILILSMVLLASCGSDSEDAAQAAGECSNTKTEASVWTRRSDGFVFDLRGTENDTVYEMVIIDDGTCNDSDEEFLFGYVTGEKTFYEFNCAGDTLTYTFDYNITCQNVLELTDRATGETQYFD